LKKGSKRKIFYFFLENTKMMKLCLLFGLCLAYALAAEETALSATCTPQILNKHLQCEEQAIFEGLKTKRLLMKAGFECFEKNKCEFCSEEEEEGEHGSGSGHTPSPTEKAEEECLQELMESEHKNLSACVSGLTNGLDLPRFPGHHKKGHREERGHSGSGSGSAEWEERRKHKFERFVHSGSGSGSGEWEERRKHKFERFEHKVREACHNNNESVKAVFECLKKNESVAEQDKEQFCAARQICESEIEGKCDREDEKFAEEEIRKALKTCEPKTAIQALIKEAKACQALDPNHVERKHHENKKKGEHYGERHHSGSGSGSGSGRHRGHREHREGREHHDFCKAKKEATATSG
jgi:hypothetical protein